MIEIDNLNRKEQFILKLYREKFENRTFDEADVCSFVMFLRSHISKNDFPCIHDFGDAVAHRKRNKGRVYNSMKQAHDNKYATKPNSKEIIGYNGITNDLWFNEWRNIGKKFEIQISDEAIKEILICMISALQFSEYKDLGQMKLIYGKDFLAVTTVENNRHSPYIMFAVVKDVTILKRSLIPKIREPVFAFRKDGELQLIDENGDRIL